MWPGREVLILNSVALFEFWANKIGRRGRWEERQMGEEVFESDVERSREHTSDLGGPTHYHFHGCESNCKWTC